MAAVTIAFATSGADELAVTARRYLTEREPYPSAPNARVGGDEILARCARLAALGWSEILDPSDDSSLAGAAENLAALFVGVGGHPTTAPLVDMLVGVPLALGGSDLAAAGSDRLSVLATAPAVDAHTMAADPWTGVEISAGAATGAKTLVNCAEIASVFIVTARHNGEPCLARIDRPALGVVTSPLDSPDRLARFGTLSLVDADCQVLSQGEAAVACYNTVRTLARLCSIAEMTGLAGRALDFSVEYAKIRHQFGRPIGAFQAIKHLLAEARCAVHGLESTLLRAVREMSGGRTSGDALAAAYLYAMGATEQVMDVALQVHGGIGYTMENPMSWYYLRAATLRAQWGEPLALARQLAQHATGPAVSRPGLLQALDNRTVS